MGRTLPQAGRHTIPRRVRRRRLANTSHGAQQALPSLVTWANRIMGIPPLSQPMPPSPRTSTTSASNSAPSALSKQGPAFPSNCHCRQPLRRTAASLTRPLWSTIPRPPARSPTSSSTYPVLGPAAARTPWTPGSPTRRCAGITAPTTSSGRPDLLHSLTEAPRLTSVPNALKFVPFSYRLILIRLPPIPISSAPYWQVGSITLQG